MSLLLILPPVLLTAAALVITWVGAVAARATAEVRVDLAGLAVLRAACDQLAADVDANSGRWPRTDLSDPDPTSGVR